MAKTANLSKAKETKNDEFYTPRADIQKEVNAYLEFNPDTFRGKSVLLPCDDPEWSAFTKFFAQNFETFGLRRLVSTSYAFDSKNTGRDASTKRPKSGRAVGASLVSPDAVDYGPSPPDGERPRHGGCNAMPGADGGERVPEPS